VFAYWAVRKSAESAKVYTGQGCPDSGDVCVADVVSSDEILEAATVDDMAARNYSAYGAER